MNGYPISILKKIEDTDNFELDIKLFTEILNNEQTKDCEVSIISIAGAFRKGKSFILNFLINFLNADKIQQENGDWINNMDDNFNGFEWRNGIKPHTSGILIWSEIFYQTLDDGRKIAIILMDTQGILDNKTPMLQNAILFGFSTMMASVQIFNVSQLFGDDNFQHLQLFTEYGKFALEISNEKPFQKLLILIRDWQDELNFPYGTNGGNKYLTSTENPNYENVDCFLMPHPGLKVSSNFKKKLSDVDNEFIDYVKEFTQLLLAKKNLIVKKVNGINILAKDLVAYINRYWKYLNDETIPVPKSVFSVSLQIILIFKVILI